MANLDVSLAVICEQRQKRLSLILTPPNRYDPVNPYEKYPATDHAIMIFYLL